MSKNKFKYIISPIILSVIMFTLINNIEKNDELKSQEKYVFNETDEEGDKSNETSNKQIIGNYYLGEKNWILGKFSKLLPESEMKVYSGAINELSSISNDMGKSTYFVSMAHKTNMLKHLYPNFVTNRCNIDINKTIFKKNLDLKNMKFIDLDEAFSNSFSKENLEEFYFKTDPHWNGRGAYEGFKIMVKNMDLGLTDEEIENHFSKYKVLVNGEKDFIGSYNKKLGFPIEEKEKTSFVYLEGAKYKYFLSDTNKDIKIKEKDIMATRRDKDSWDYGGAYMRGSNCNILKIKNAKSLTDKKVVVFRDSYEAPMTLLLADMFSEVEIVDPRYIDNLDMTYEDIIKNSDSDTVLFMYNSFGFSGMIKEMIDKGIK